MSRPSRAPLDEEEAEDDDEEETDDLDDDDEEPEPPRRHGRPRPRRGRHKPAPRPVRRWRGPNDEEDDEETEEAPARAPGQRTVYWRARDSLWFEPLVALAIIVVLLVSLFAYTQNWPPIYVVESDSMQHGPSDQLGLINTGDLVLAQKVSTSSIVPYVTGLQTGYSTYGEYGDVLLYFANGQSSSGSTPIIHRAILFLEWNPLGYYNATDLTGLPCGTAPNAVYATGIPPGPLESCNTTRLTGELALYHVGWNSTNIYLNLGAPALGRHSGFLTMGDKNRIPDQNGSAVPAISELVEPGWVIGVARGMIPWFGSLKLLLEGSAGEVPPQSWEFMGLTLIGAILVAFGVHWALRTEGIETPLRREEEEEATQAAAAASPPEEGRHGWLSRLHRRRPDDEDEEEDDEERTRAKRRRPRTSPAPSHRGRPAPHVKRAEKPSKKRHSDDEL